MLIPQIPYDYKKKIATEFKLDLKLLSASRKVESDTEDNKITRLKTAVEFIKTYGNIGTVDSPNEYVEGVLDMQWGIIGKANDVIYFGTQIGNTIIGLGGSSRHLIGGQNGREFNTFGSTLQNIVMHLRLQRLSKLDEASNEQDFDGKTRDVVEGGGFSGEAEHWSASVWKANKLLNNLGMPEQRIEFVAKKLAFGANCKIKEKNGRGEERLLVNREVNVLLASPLYAALVE